MTQPPSGPQGASAPHSVRSTLAADLKRYNAKRSGLVGALESFWFAPGFAVLVRHRVAAWLYQAGGVPRVLGLLLWRHNTNVSACHISLRSNLGPGLFLPHPTAVVIGDSVTVGRNVTIYQSVTLGRRGDGEYPVVAEGVTIYAGAVVAGPVRLGVDAVVGANSFVAHSVADRITVAGVPARPLVSKTSPS